MKARFWNARSDKRLTIGVITMIKKITHSLLSLSIAFVALLLAVFIMRDLGAETDKKGARYYQTVAEPHIRDYLTPDVEVSQALGSIVYKIPKDSEIKEKYMNDLALFQEDQFEAHRKAASYSRYSTTYWHDVVFALKVIGFVICGIACVVAIIVAIAMPFETEEKPA